MQTLTSGQPLDAIGGLSSPHLPAHHPYKQPTTNLEVMMIFLLDINICKQKIVNDLIHPWSTGTKKHKYRGLAYCINENQVQRQMKDLMNFPLAVYLFSLVCNTSARFLMENTKILFICKFSIKVGGLITDTLVLLCTWGRTQQETFEPC